GRAVVEDVAQMRAAGGANGLDPAHAVGVVRDLAHGSRNGLVEARPARPRIELRVRAEERAVASGASIRAVLGGRELARERRLGALLPEHGVLLRREPLLPSILR